MKIKFKLLIILSVLLTIFIFCETNCPIIDKNINKQQSLSSVSKYLANISLDKFKEIKKNQETFFIYVNNNSCSDCQIFNIQLSKELQTNESLRIIKCLDITSLHSNDQLWNTFKNQNMIEGTPSFIFFKNGKITNTYGWTKQHNIQFNTFLKWFNNNLNDI